MTRFKRFGQLLVVEPPPRVVEEVPINELSRDTSRVLARVREGRRIVVTKHGSPAAVILEVEEAIGLCATRLLTRQEAERRLFGTELEARLRGRRVARFRRELEGARRDSREWT